MALLEANAEGTTPPSISSDREWAFAVFAEVNEHMRTTESKQMAVSTAYLSILALALSFVADRQGQFFAASMANLVVFLVLAGIGCVVFASQRWFRVWKEHYLDVLAAIARDFDVADAHLPLWLRRPRSAPTRSRRVAFSIDNVLPYFTVATTAALLLLFDWTLGQLFGQAIGVAGLAITTVVFIAFLALMQRQLNRQNDAFLIA